jgi:CPA1 family monovalent cation:H+ antiporter
MDSLRVLLVEQNQKIVPLRWEKHMANSCEHLERLSAKDFPPQRTPDACEECLSEGTVWVALRECQSCGHVGCCDSSTGKHATKHFHETQHPVMRAVPPAAWIWCYVHEAQGTLG